MLHGGDCARLCASWLLELVNSSPPKDRRGRGWYDIRHSRIRLADILPLTPFNLEKCLQHNRLIDSVSCDSYKIFHSIINEMWTAMPRHIVLCFQLLTKIVSTLRILLSKSEFLLKNASSVKYTDLHSLSTHQFWFRSPLLNSIS